MHGWIDLMLRSMGWPGQMTKRLKLLFLIRLIALWERNYILLELGSRDTGKATWFRIFRWQQNEDARLARSDSLVIASKKIAFVRHGPLKFVV